MTSKYVGAPEPPVGRDFNLTWAGTSADMFEPGASKRARALPMLSGAARRR